MYSIALFDYDGVIVASAEIKAQGFVECFASEPASVREAIRAYVTTHGGESRFAKFRYIHDVILGRSLSSAGLADLCDCYRQYVIEKVQRAPFVSGVLELIHEIYRTTDCYIVSGTPQDELRDLVRLRGIDGLFKDVLGSPTPKTELTKEVVRRYDGRRDAMVFIGDSLTDYEAARAAYVAFLGVRAPGAAGGLPQEVEIVTDLTAYRSRFQ